MEGGRPHLTEVARKLRGHSPKAEDVLWKHLRGRRFKGFKFRRQHPYERYILDFVCLEKRLIIELDGGQHARERTKDEIRDHFLLENGFRTLRFWDNQVFQNLEGVLKTILKDLPKK